MDQKETDESLDLIDWTKLFWAIRRRWVLVTAIVLIAAVGAYFYTVSLPKIYRSTATILPPGAIGPSVGVFPPSAALAAIPGLGTAIGARNPADLFTVILKSRRMAEDVINRFDLMTVYRQAYRERAEKALATATKVTVSKEGLITIAVEDTVPQRAADIANYYTANLDVINRQIQVEMSRQRRTFFKEQSQMMTRNLGDVDAELGTRLGTLSRDMGVGQQVIGALLQQYQQAKIEEAKNIPLVQILDPAVPAELHVKPSKRNNVAAAVALSGFVAVGLAYWIESRKGKDTGRSAGK